MDAATLFKAGKTFDDIGVKNGTALNEAMLTVPPNIKSNTDRANWMTQVRIAYEYVIATALASRAEKRKENAKKNLQHILSDDFKSSPAFTETFGPVAITKATRAPATRFDANAVRNAMIIDGIKPEKADKYISAGMITNKPAELITGTFMSQ